MKRLFLIMTLFALSLPVIADTHTVARGENLQSIAAKYNITETELIEANPGADKLFYIGLKLNIPQPKQTAVAPTSAQPVQPVQTIQNDSQTTYASAENTGNKHVVNDDKPGTDCSIMLEYGFLTKEKEARGSNYTYAFSIGGNYYFMHRMSGVFAGARIGYNSANYNHYESYRGSYYTSTSTAHFITLPINAGYAFATDDRNLALTPYAGVDCNFCVGGKSKTKGRVEGVQIDQESKFKKKVGLDARIGIQLRLWGFNIGASYVMPLNKNQKQYFGDESYIAINLGCGF
ncbi:MAG: outer membrane beta-barrel protein [Paramuribaculum sp.]|nr:outer membrane beta-barrel protein [Paramuribaculum sp.]